MFKWWPEAPSPVAELSNRVVRRFERRYGPPMPLHYVDPHKKHGRWNKANERFFRTRPGQFMAHHCSFGRRPVALSGNRGSLSDGPRRHRRRPRWSAQAQNRVSGVSINSPISTMELIRS